MNEFKEKIIIPDNNIGELIKEAREKKGLDLKKVSRKLNIRKEYLLSIENNRIDLLPDGIYGKKFLKKYTDYLNIDKDLIKTTLEDLENLKKDDPFSTKKADKKDFLVFPKIARNIIFFLIVLACALYLSLYAKKIFSTPNIEILYPENNLSISEKTITVKGNIEQEAELNINEELVLSNSDGYFEKEINLKEGANNIVITAKKRYGEKIIINRYILVE